MFSRLHIHALVLGNAQIKTIHTPSVHPIQSLDSVVVHSFPVPHNLCCAHPASAPGLNGWYSLREKLCSTLLPPCWSCAVPHLIHHPPLQEESLLSSWALLQKFTVGSEFLHRCLEIASHNYKCKANQHFSTYKEYKARGDGGESKFPMYYNCNFKCPAVLPVRLESF